MWSLKNLFLYFTLPLNIIPCIALPLIAAETISNQQLGLRLTIPDGFVQDPGKVKGDVVCAFQRSPAAGQKMGTSTLVSGLGEAITRLAITIGALMCFAVCVVAIIITLVVWNVVRKRNSSRGTLEPGDDSRTMSN